MKSPSLANVLVIADGVDEMQTVVADLKNHFKHVDAVTSESEARSVLEHRSVDVLVLAFEELDDAQPYSRIIGSAERSVAAQRLVLLCKQEDSAVAFELCKRHYFDDYVAYWPALSVWLECRIALSLREAEENGIQLLTHAKQLGELDRKVAHELNMGEKQAVATQDSMAGAGAKNWPRRMTTFPIIWSRRGRTQQSRSKIQKH